MASRARSGRSGGRSNIEKRVDEIMNEVIVAHSPNLAPNASIKRSISTRKFKNVRVITEIDDIRP
jgi:hypothetical protein